MWRFSQRAGNQVSRLRNTTQGTLSVVHGPNKLCPLCLVRLYATPIPPAAGGGALRLILGFLGASAAVTGGTVAYAKFDEAFRGWLEKSVPYADVALGQILGGPEPAKPITKPSTAGGSQSTTGSDQIKEKAIQSGLLQKKLEREAAQKEKTSAAAPSPPVASPTSTPETTKSLPVVSGVAGSKVVEGTSKPVQQPQKADSKTDVTKSITDADIKDKLAGQDAVSAAENSAVEMLVRHTVNDLSVALAAALSAYQVAGDSVKVHTKNLQKALDVTQGSNQEEAWKTVDASAAAKVSAITEAENQGLQARLALQKVKAVIDEGRKSKIVAGNATLVSAEEAVNEAITSLQKAELEVSMIDSESKVLTEYKSLVEQGTELLRKEVQGMKPQASFGEAGKKLSDDELSYLIAHAHLKIEHLKKQLEIQQTSEKARLQQSLGVQRREYEKLVNTKTSAELDRQQRELQITYQKKFNDLNEEFETELLQQLRRQAAAHSEHLRDVVTAQRRELDAEYEQLVEDRVGDARHEFQRGLAGSLGRLKGIESGLNQRSELDRAIRRSQRLWVACQALRHSIQRGRPEAGAWEDQRKPLATEIAAISKAAGNDDAFVVGVLKSIADEAARQGVFTADALTDRFFKVDTVCRQVALVDDRHGNASLLRYALSYVQSLLVAAQSPAHLPSSAELADEPLDADRLNTFSLLDRARWCIDRGELEQALRYVNQLRGVPRRVAADWIRETRLLLEVRQAADALLARAAAVEVQAVAAGATASAAATSST